MTYRLSKFKETDSGAFTATIMLDGKSVGSVENSGRGGSNLYWFNTPADMWAYEIQATTLFPKEVSEVSDCFLNHLILLFEANRIRGIVAVTSEYDFLETGRYLSFKTGTDISALKTHLLQTRGVPYLVWDKKSYSFA